MTEKITSLESVVSETRTDLEDKQSSIETLKGDKVSLEMKMAETEETRDGEDMDEHKHSLARWG